MYSTLAFIVWCSLTEAGEYFGERALLCDEPRAADVIADSPTTCLILSREQFTTLLGPLRHLMTKAVLRIAIPNVPVLKDLPVGGYVVPVFAGLPSHACLAADTHVTRDRRLV